MSRIIAILTVVVVIIGLAVYSQTGIDPESAGRSPDEGLRAIAPGYGAIKGSDKSIIMTEEEEW